MHNRNRRSAQVTALLVVVLLLLLTAAACTQAPAAPAGQSGLSAQNVWARTAKMMGGTPMEGDTHSHDTHSHDTHSHNMQQGGANSAVYMLLANKGTAADRLVAAEADVAKSIEIHETKMEGDMMRMQPVEGGIEVPAGGQVELKPGGYHVMLIGLTRDLNAGEKFPVTLKFASGATLKVEAEVREP